MTGAQHFAEAERLLEPRVSTAGNVPRNVQPSPHEVATAGVHATLALAAAVERNNRLAHGVDVPGYGAS